MTDRLQCQAKWVTHLSRVIDDDMLYVLLCFPVRIQSSGHIWVFNESMIFTRRPYSAGGYDKERFGQHHFRRRQTQ
ncbi:hypothetical protein OUZ56_012915 [Daphnia magna]|uniref:Uncharacterized protein n=1 Tax=Daphnia magna TaxID=35525 RepID=A0ABQ9Z4F4_9CRUS|nr:hypothetical protein OUZ56_012915 [Daphnia magna]